jgi:hypothetical protein
MGNEEKNDKLLFKVKVIIKHTLQKVLTTYYRNCLLFLNNNSSTVLSSYFLGTNCTSFVIEYQFEKNIETIERIKNCLGL